MRLNAIQFAYVTRNLDRSVERLRNAYGHDSFIFFDPDIEVMTSNGPGRQQTRVAMTWDGATQIEIIQPVGGLIDLYLPYLPADDSMRFHHSAVAVDDWPAFKRELAAAGVTPAIESGLDGLDFVYLDARESLGHYVEYIWATPSGGRPWAARMPRRRR